MSVLPAHMYVYRVHSWCQKRLEEDIGSQDRELETMVSSHVSDANQACVF